MLDLAVLVLAVARVNRLVRNDEAGYPIRWLLFRLLPSGFVDRLLACPFCIGFWLSLAGAWSWLAWGDSDLWLWATLPFAVSWLVGHAGSIDDRES
jgi:hypothetical protein